MTITDEQLAEWAKLAEAVAPGPWKWEPHGPGWALYSGRDDQHHGLNLITVGKDGFDWTGEPMREFTALSRTALPALLAEVRRLRSILPRDGEVLLKVPYLKVSELAGDVLVELDTDSDFAEEVWLEGYQVVAMGKPPQEDTHE